MEKVALFDPFSAGHHAEYIWFLVEKWLTSYQHIKLDVLFPKKGILAHGKLKALYHNSPENLTFIPIEEAIGSLLNIHQKHIGILELYLKNNKPNHILLPYFDQAQLVLASQFKFPKKTRVSGILFRAENHLKPRNTSDLKEKITRIRKGLLLKGTAHHRQWHTLFCLDENAPNYLNKTFKGINATPLADPMFPLAAEGNIDIKANHQIPKHHKIFLLQGHIDKRKGIIETLIAFSLCPIDFQQNVTLLIAGKCEPSFKTTLKTQIARLNLALQVIIDDGFIPYNTFSDYIEQSDVVLIPYQEVHIGSSGLQIRAAAFGKPSISPNYGLLKARNHQYKLGISINTKNPKELAIAIQDILHQSIIDKNLAMEFALQHTPQRFATQIWETLILPFP